MPLIDGDVYHVEDSALAASSSRTADHGPKASRLNKAIFAGAWCDDDTATDGSAWIEVIGIQIAMRFDCVTFQNIEENQMTSSQI